MNKLLRKATSPPFALKLLGTGGPESPRKVAPKSSKKTKKKLELKIPVCELKILTQLKFIESSAKSPQKKSRISPWIYHKNKELDEPGRLRLM